MRARAGELGITLIEMLAALAVSALIGVAGFTLLEGVTLRDAQLSGRLERVMARDRAFRLILRDVTAARFVMLTEDGELELEMVNMMISWRAQNDGLSRLLTWPDGSRLRQLVLEEPAVLSPDPAIARLARLHLPQADVERLVPLPSSRAP